jgi:hypothetical protein
MAQVIPQRDFHEGQCANISVDWSGRMQQRYAQDLAAKELLTGRGGEY